MRLDSAQSQTDRRLVSDFLLDDLGDDCSRGLGGGGGRGGGGGGASGGGGGGGRGREQRPEKQTSTKASDIHQL